jgi:hypothetical protein
MEEITRKLDAIFSDVGDTIDAMGVWTHGMPEAQEESVQPTHTK